MLNFSFNFEANGFCLEPHMTILPLSSLGEEHEGQLSNLSFSVSICRCLSLRRNA